MEVQPKSILKYGVWVWCNERADLSRSQECLCLNCRLLNNGCRQSSLLFEICKSFNLAFLMTRCPDWLEKGG